MASREALSGSQGSVLEPIAAMRCPITLEPDQHILVDSVLGVAQSRGGALHLIEKYQDSYLDDRVFELAWKHNHVVHRPLNETDTAARLYSTPSNALVYSSSRKTGTAPRR